MRIPRCCSPALVGLLLLGCEPETEDLEELGASAPALNGQIMTIACSAHQEANLQAAMNIALDHVGGSKKDEMLACLGESTMSMGGGQGYPEDILGRMRQGVGTWIVCKDLGGSQQGEAENDISNEVITIDSQIAANPQSIASLAALVLHEISHNKGFRHIDELGQEYPYTVPQQLRYCSNSISKDRYTSFLRGKVFDPDGPMRSSVKGRVELHRVGRNGGEPFGDDDCGTARFARGLNLRAGEFIDAIGLRCSDDDGGGTIKATTQRGGPGGDVRNLDCGEGDLMVGVRGFAGEKLDDVAPICASVPIIGQHRPQTRALALRGGTGGRAFERLCPAGMAVKSLAGRAGEHVDQLSLVCQPIADPFDPSTTAAPRAGNRQGTTYKERCTTGLMTEIWGMSGDRIDRLGGACKQARMVNGGLEPVGENYVLPAHGGSGGKPFWDFCPGGTAIVGFKLRAGDTVDAITAVCADVSWWRLGAPTTTIELDKAGGNGGQPLVSMCPSKKFVTGWVISEADSEVTSLQPLCSNF